ncbi:MAG: AMP-binding protein, partial [Verrucomicrobiales bacterium]|nr:AMP-binding protein [Verrucomicrobiales bacterium]
WYLRTFQPEPGLRFSQFSGLGHDPFFREVLGALSSGGTLCLPAADEPDLPRWLRAQHIAVAHLTPPLARWLFADPTPAPDLRLVVFAGDRLRDGDVLAARQIAPQARLVNAYGSTETPQILAWHEVTRAELPSPSGSPPVGRGIENAQLILLADGTRQAGVGELGEIAARTPHLALGYLNHPPATEAAFIRNPLTRLPHDRLYLTGDLGRYQPDGTVVYAGRRDRQRKLRGHRIEPGAIEAALRTHPGIREAATLILEAPADRDELVAFVVSQAEPIPAPTLRAHLQGLLAPHEVPQRFLFVDSLPLTPNGKLHHAALATLAASTPAVASPSTSVPASDLESRMLKLWSEALARPQLGIHDDFFENGGHSLLALGLLARLNSEFQARLTLRTFFDHRTVAELCLALHPTKPHTPSDTPRPPRRLRGAAHGIPFFVIPGYFGLGYLRPSIASEVARVCPYYDGFRYAGVEDQLPPHRSLEAIAAHLIPQLDAVMPSHCDTLCLGGFSFGGTVAFEMARQLTQAGRRVPLLILFDSRMHRGLRARSRPEVALELLRRASRQPRGQRLDFLRRMLRGRAARASSSHAQKRSSTPGPATLPADTRPEVGASGLLKESVRLASLHAGRQYLPGPYPGRVLLLRGTEEVPNEWLRLELDESNGWRPFATGELEIIHIPRQHLGIYTEPIHPLVIERTVHALRSVQDAFPTG